MRARPASRNSAMTAGLQPMPAPCTRTAEGRIAIEVGPPRGLLRLRADTPAPPLSPPAGTGYTAAPERNWPVLLLREPVAPRRPTVEAPWPPATRWPRVARVPGEVTFVLALGTLISAVACWPESWRLRSERSISAAVEKRWAGSLAMDLSTMASSRRGIFALRARGEGGGSLICL